MRASPGILSLASAGSPPRCLAHLGRALLPNLGWALLPEKKRKQNKTKSKVKTFYGWARLPPTVELCSWTHWALLWEQGWALLPAWFLFYFWYSWALLLVLSSMTLGKRLSFAPPVSLFYCFTLSSVSWFHWALLWGRGGALLPVIILFFVQFTLAGPWEPRPRAPVPSRLSWPFFIQKSLTNAFILWFCKAKPCSQWIHYLCSILFFTNGWALVLLPMGESVSLAP